MKRYQARNIVNLYKDLKAKRMLDSEIATFFAISPSALDRVKKKYRLQLGQRGWQKKNKTQVVMPVHKSNGFLRVTLTDCYLRPLNITPGDKVEIVIENNEIRIRKYEPRILPDAQLLSSHVNSDDNR